MQRTAPQNRSAIALSTRISTHAARGAEITPTMPYVLGIGLALAASTMSLAWVIPALVG